MPQLGACMGRSHVMVYFGRVWKRLGVMCAWPGRSVMLHFFQAMAALQHGMRTPLRVMCLGGGFGGMLTCQARRRTPGDVTEACAACPAK